MAVNPLLVTSSLLKGLEGFGAYQEYKGLAKALNLQADLTSSAIPGIIQQGELEAGNIEKAGNKFIAQQVAAYANVGVRFEGSPAMVMAQTAKTIRQDMILTRLNAAQQASNVGFEAMQQKIKAGQQKTKALLALSKSFVDIGSGLAVDNYAGKKTMPAGKK